MSYSEAFQQTRGTI